MVAMMAEMEADQKQEATVEGLELKEEADDSEIALDKLKAIMASSACTPIEIEGAIAIAKHAGVAEDNADLQAAVDKVNQLKSKAKTLDRLRNAIQYPNVDELTEVIKLAEAEGLAKADIDKAKEALKIETPKQKAREALKAAQSAGDPKMLKDAIAEAEAAKLSKEEVEEFQELLKGAESKEQAQKALSDAMASKDVAALKF